MIKLRKGSSDLEFGSAKATVSLNIDGKGVANLSSGSAFLDHMLAAFSKIGGLDMKANASGSSYNRAIALGMAIGQALDRALADRRGIRRYGSAAVPMDESLADIALDLSGRPYLIFRGEFASDLIADLSTQDIKLFFEALADGARMTLHIEFYGENDHHKAESIFKALGLAFRAAVIVEGSDIPSTKGVI